MDCKKKISVKKTNKATQITDNNNNNTAHNHILLAYVYVLSDKMTTVSCGYSAQTFEPIVALQATNRPPVCFSASDFLQFFAYAPSLVESMESECSSKTIRLNSFSMVPTKNKTKQIILFDNSKCHNKVKLDLGEVKFLLNMQDFLRSLLFEYMSNMTAVKNYFDTYLNLCIKNNVLDLKIENNFTPITTKKLDYYRLYVELPQLCAQKIHTEVSKCIYNKKQ